VQTLRLYLDVARLRSFSQAAGRHGITQSAASQRIHALEERLGVTLIDRSVRPLELTEAGELYLRGVGELVERYDKLERKVAALRPAPSGTVRVSAIYSAGIDLLEAVQGGFEAQHPDVTVEIAYDQPEGVYQAVLNQQCDLGILSYPNRWKKVGIIPLRDEPMSVVCAPGHELSSRARVHASQLGRYDMVTFESSLPAGRRIRAYLRDHEVSPRITHTFDNVDTIKSAVAVTDRIAILPTRTVLREAAAGTLVSVKLEPALHRPIGILFPRSNGVAGHGGLPGAAQAFVDYLLAHAGPTVDAVGLVQAATKRELSGATP
jgi:DNA-binding transcriptional LysR family regulator